MHAALEAGAGNLAIGTRIPDPTKPGGLSPARQRLSDLGKWFFGLVAGVDVSDPMSGFFMTRREIVAKHARKLSPDGFKILVDLVLTARHDLKVVEIPYVFRPRTAGESKLSPLVGFDFLGLVAHHASGGVLPVRFVLFAMIGGVGLIVHLVVLTILIGGGDARAISPMSQTVATDRRDGQQFHPQQRDHLPQPPLPRLRQDRRLRHFRGALRHRRRRQHQRRQRAVSLAPRLGPRRPRRRA